MRSDWALGGLPLSASAPSKTNLDRSTHTQALLLAEGQLAGLERVEFAALSSASSGAVDGRQFSPSTAFCTLGRIRRRLKIPDDKKKPNNPNNRGGEAVQQYFVFGINGE